LLEEDSFQCFSSYSPCRQNAGKQNQQKPRKHTMAKIDPTDSQWGGEPSDRILPCGSGVKDFVGIGFEHFTINGKSCIEVRSICINDASPNGDDEGKELRDLFFLHSRGALSRFVKFAKDGCGWVEPFDPEDPADVHRIVHNRPFRCKVKASPSGNEGQYTRHDCGWSYEPPQISQDPATGRYELEPYQSDAVSRASASWDGYQRWRELNPRDTASKPTASGYGSNSGGSNYGGNKSGGSGSNEYDDILF
jgi:hypothetical protein